MDGHLGRYATFRTTDDYRQAGDCYRSVEHWEREDLIASIGGSLKQCPEPIQLRMVCYLWHCDEDFGSRVAEVAGIDLARAIALPPLPCRLCPASPCRISAACGRPISAASRKSGRSRKPPALNKP